MIHSLTTPPPIPGDADLVRASLDGDREAFGRIVVRYQSLICSVIYSSTGNLSRSEDLAQETFLAAWRHLGELREPGRLRAWLCGIARNLVNGARRSARRDPGHEAEALESIADAQASEPLPVERVIGEEEAGILWRALERIPETYREPLVLFYREHQSVETVARQLDLEEAAVRQRLSRGRKLLEAEVQGFVESALARSSPGRRFTLAVMAGLPMDGTAAKLGAWVAAAAKTGSTAKAAGTLGVLGSSLAMVGAVLFSWKTAVDDCRSPRERRLMIRMGWIQLGMLVLSLVASYLGLPLLAGHPVALGLTLAGLLLALFVAAAWSNAYLTRRRAEIWLEDGFLTGRPDGEEGRMTERAASRRAFRLVFPCVILLAAGCLGLPWRGSPGRSAAVGLAGAGVLFWGFRRFRLQCLGQVRVAPAEAATPSGRLLRRPAVTFAAVIFGSALLAGLLPIFLLPRPVKFDGPPDHRWQVAILALTGAVSAALLGLAVYSWLRRRLTVEQPKAVLDRTYAPLMAQMNLSAEDGERLKVLVLEKTRAVVECTVRLTDRRIEASRRAELVEEVRRIQREHEGRLRDFLGEERHARFRRFEKSLPERRLVNDLSRRTSRSSDALTPTQVDALLQAFAEARDAFPWTNGLSRRDPEADDYASLFDPANLRLHAKEEERFDREFLERARSILRPGQVGLLESLQENRRRSELAEFRSAARMFRGPTVEAPTPRGEEAGSRSRRR